MTSDWKKAADEMDALKDSGRELDGLVRVNARIADAPLDKVTFRISPDELIEVSAAARAIGQDVGDFIRESSVRRAREIAAGAEKAREVLAAYLPSRYRPDMTDEEVEVLLRELRNAVLDASSVFPAKTA